MLPELSYRFPPSAPFTISGFPLATHPATVQSTDACAITSMEPLTLPSEMLESSAGDGVVCAVSENVRNTKLDKIFIVVSPFLISRLYLPLHAFIAETDRK